MSFPRKRASVACNYCRHRKRRCDSQTPVCGLCRETGTTCEYPEVPNERPDNELTRRIDELTELVLKQSQAIEALTKESSAYSARLSLLSGRGGVTASANPTAAYSSSESEFGHDIWSTQSCANSKDKETPGASVTVEDQADADDPPLTIPVGHHTTTGSLFSLPQLRAVLGDYPEDFMFQIESRRILSFRGHRTQSLEDELSLLDRGHESHQGLIKAFFSFIYPNFPVLTPEIFQPIYDKVMKDGFHCDAESSLCLTVLALGKLTTNLASTGNIEMQHDLNGMEYFSIAYRISVVEWGASFAADLILPSTLVHGAIYLFYMAKPLQAWKLVTLASSNLQLIKASPVTVHRGLNREQLAYIDRLVWACYILESDCLAEFHLPRSGIELVVDKMAFPPFESPLQRDCLLFLALCSVRRLFNRIHNALYSKSEANLHPSSPQGTSRPGGSVWSHNTLTPTSLTKICAELSRQLGTWYMSLPDTIRPDFSNDVPIDLYDGWLRLRYWSAQHIIYRPCLLYASSFQRREELPSHIITNCVACIQSCRNCINTAHHLRMNRTQYTWMTTYGVLACSLILTIASTNAFLMELVPDIYDLLGKVAETMEGLNGPDSIAEFVIAIVQIIRQRHRYQAMLPAAQQIRH